MRRYGFLAGLLVGFLLGALAVWLPGRFPRWVRPEGARAVAGPVVEQVRRVQKVIDGDTVVLDGGERVRILGIDTPERGEPFYEEASAAQSRMSLGRSVRIKGCAAEPRDAYGRTLAFLYVDGKDVGEALLRAGLARTLFVGPCGRRSARAYRRIEREAFRGGRGIWSLQHPRRVTADRAAAYVGCLMTVTGRVLRVHGGPKAFHLNFGRDYRTDFTVVVFRKDLPGLLSEGLPPVTAFKGRTVEVTGLLKDYQGPEIVVESADQVVLPPGDLSREGSR